VRAMVQIVPVVQRSRGALVGGQDGPAALERLMNLPGQRVRIVHTPFIRLPDAENVVRDARLLSHQQVDAGRGPGGDRDPSGSLMYHGVHRYFETLLATLSCKR